MGVGVYCGPRVNGSNKLGAINLGVTSNSKRKCKTESESMNMSTARLSLRLFVLCGLLTLLIAWQGTTVALAQADTNDADTNGITQPAAGETISGTVELRGIASSPNFEKWQIDLLLFGEAENATYIDFLRAPRRSAAPFTTLDTTRYPDGDHTLRLRVVQDDYNYDEYFTPVTIDNSGAQAGLASGITMPEAGETVSREVRVRGVAFDPGTQGWQLDLLLFGAEEDATFISRRGGRQFPRERLFARLDTTQYPDGEHVLRLRTIFGDTSYNEYFTPITIDNSEQPTNANNGILDPEEGATVSGTVRVRGIADDPNFLKWQLDLLLFGVEEDATSLNVNRNPRPQRRQFERLNTTNYPDGEHVLRLRVVTDDYNYTEYFTTIVIDNSALESSGNASNGDSDADDTGQSDDDEADDE